MRIAGVLSLLALAVVAASPGPASAVRLLWTFEDAVFDDGGALTGSFVYDAETNHYSRIALSTSAGTVFAGTTYPGPHLESHATSKFLGPVDRDAADLRGAVSLSLFFGRSGRPGLTDTATSVDLLIAQGPGNGSRENDCLGEQCLNSQGFRGLTRGRVVSSPVPEPASGALLWAGLGALAWRRRAPSRLARP